MSLRPVLCLALLCASACAKVEVTPGREEIAAESAANAKTHLGKIKHVVVLMEENQSYDHLMGWYDKAKHKLTGDEYNLLNATDPDSKKIYVGKTAPYVNFCDPDHAYPPTQYKIYGPDAYGKSNFTDPTMSGFVEFEYSVLHHSKPSLHSCGVMDMFDSSTKLPIMTTLADEFVLFDKFFCSIPGPTWPNRLFFLAATSAGLTETIPWYQDKVGQLFPVKTVFDQVEESGGTWRYYYDDTPWEMFVEKLAHSPEHTFQMEKFYADAREGTLPSFSFINPRNGINITSGLGSNDQHPDHDVALGEALYKNVYEALRNGPSWNDTLFVLTYDEHGGFYDHIKPSTDIPSPGDFNNHSYPDNFDFTRGGIRIPTLLASPWLKKGTIVSDPPDSAKPTPSSMFELTSIMATVRKLLPMTQDLPPLTKRDAWAATFEHLFAELDEPRTDCPTTLPDAPPPSLEHAKIEAELPVNSLQTHTMTVLAELISESYPAHIKRQGDVAVWTQAAHERHRKKTFEWKKSKQERKNFEVKDVACDTSHNRVANSWVLNKVNGNLSSTISTTIVHVDFCLDVEKVEAHQKIGISTCYPNATGHNRDRHQQWVYKEDHSMRPMLDETLCLTNHFFGGVSEVRLEVCEGNRNQHYAFFAGKATETAELFFGAWGMTCLSVFAESK